MNIPLLALPLSQPIPGGLKKRRVLLIDSSHTKRDLRADVLRKLGVDVDTAADMAEARSWWRPALYDLVLVNMEKGRGQRDKFCNDIRSATPQQRLAFLVGQPEYLVDLPSDDQELAMKSGDEQVASGSVLDLAPKVLGGKNQRWGILEASRRISAVRSASVARTRALRALPPPVRDSEARREKPGATFGDLVKEELR